MRKTVLRARLLLPLLALCAGAFGQTVSSVAVAPSSVIGGVSATGTVTLSAAAPSAGVTVTLASSSSAASVPATVKVAAKSLSAPFAVKTTSVAVNVSATLSASVASSKKTAALLVTAPTPKSLTLSPSSVIGGANSTGTLTLTGPAPVGGLKVSVGSTSSAAKVTSPVTVAAGATSATFAISTVPVTANLSPMIEVSDNGTSVAVALAIAAPTLASFTINPTSVVSGTAATGTVTLTGNAPTGGQKVSIQSNATYAQAGTPVLVSAGTSSASFSITTSYIYPASTATLTAALGGKSLAAKLTVSPGSPLSTGAWPRFQADAQNSGRGRGSGAHGLVKWTCDFYGGSYSAPAIGNGELAVTSEVPGYPRVLIFGLDGTLLHAVQIGGTNPIGILGGVTPVAGPDGTFYVTTPTGACAIGPDGAVKWNCVIADPGLLSYGSLCVGPNGAVYVGGQNVTEVNSSGAITWSVPDVGGPLAVAKDGTIYSHDPTELVAIDPSGTVKWTYPISWIDDWPNAPAVDASGTVYVGNNGAGTGTLVAIDSEGAAKWTYPSGQIVATPVVGPSGAISFLTEGNVQTVSPTGKREWVVDFLPADLPLYEISAGPDGTLYVSFGTELAALNATGTAKWSTNSLSWAPQRATPASDGSIYVSFPASDLPGSAGSGISTVPGGTRFVHMLSTGKVDWTFYGGGPSAPVAIGADGTLYAPCENGTLRTVSSDGALGWMFAAPGPIMVTPTLGADGTIYFGCGDGTLCALTSLGAKKWTYAAPAPLTTAIALGSDGSVYAACSNGVLYALDLTGKLKWSFNTGGTMIHCSPAIAPDGTIYLGASSGVFAITPQGTVKWSSTLGGDGITSVGNDGTVYVGGYQPEAFSPDGKALYPPSSLISEATAPLLPASGTLHFSVVNSGAIAFDETGRTVWQWGYPGVNSELWGAIGGDGTLYVPGWGTDAQGSAQLFGVSPAGVLLWSAPATVANAFGASVGSDGTIYLVSQDRMIYAIR